MSYLPYKITALARTDSGGLNIIPNASVSIIKTGGGYSTLRESDLSTPISNPFNCDSNGEREVWLEDRSFTVSVDGGQSWDVRLTGGTDITAIATVADISTTPMQAGQIFELVEYHAGTGYGGGKLLAKLGSPTIDNGSKFASGTAGVYVERVNPQKTPYEFGYQDGGEDASPAINACTLAYGACYLDRGKTYDIATVVRARKLHSIGGKATLNCVSPTSNNRFGSTGAAVHCSPNLGYTDTTDTGTLSGVDIQNIVIQCNGLISATGSVGLKGFHKYRCNDFYMRACDVYNCASYAFWAHDDATTGTNFCSGTYDDCYAFDSQVSFEQVNVRGVTLNNCHGYISSAALSYPTAVEAIFHPYGGSDMRVTYNNCTGIADGPCPAVMLALLAAKNISVNDCQFINNYDNGINIQAAVILDGSGSSSFDSVNFDNCTLKSLYSSAVRLTPGASGGAEAAFKFNRCEIDGYQLGVYASGTGGRYSFVDCNTFARASLAVTPICYQVESGYTSFQVIGGTATASTTGSGTPTVSSLPRSIFNGTILNPNTGALPVARQRVVGTAVFGGDGSTYAVLNVILPSAVLGWTSWSVNTAKISANIQIDYGISGAADFPSAVAIAYPTVIAMPANDVVRFVGDNTLEGLTARYEITEWE